MAAASFFLKFCISKAKSEHQAAQIKMAAASKEAGVPEIVDLFRVADVKKGKPDSQGNIIEEVYTKVGAKYAVYRTPDRVVIQYADDDAKADEQRQHMASLNLARAQISGLISDWTKSKYQPFKEKAATYEGRVASALVLCLEGDGATALTSLNEIKADVLAERTSWGRFEYLISASILSLVSIFIFSWLQHKVFPFFEPSGNIWLAARAGTIGAFFSIALAIRRRTVLTSLHRRDNLADAALRILIGIVAAGVLVLMLSSKLLPNFKIGDAAISGVDISWQAILVIGFVAGFLERLVPDLLEQTASAHVDTPAGKAAAEKAVADKAVADKTAADKAAAAKAAGADTDKAAADKAAADKAAADKAAADKAAAAKAAADKAAADKAAADKAAADKAAADKAAADKAAAAKAIADKAAADKAAADKVAADKAAAAKAAPGKPAADKATAGSAAAAKVAADKVTADKAAAEEVASDKAAVEMVTADKAVLERAAGDKAADDKPADHVVRDESH
jgi:hypothetical protein